jgi:hypothetical protein
MIVTLRKKGGQLPIFKWKIGSCPPFFAPDSQRLGGIGVDGPDVCMLRAFPMVIIPPQLNLQPPGEEEFKGIVGFV